MVAYAELHALSNFSFQRAASSARELFERAKALGYRALAITDECSLAGIVRAHEAAKACELPLIIGSEFRLHDGPKLVLLVRDQTGYSLLCELITAGRRAARKGEYRVGRGEVAALAKGPEKSSTCAAGPSALGPGPSLPAHLYALWLPDEDANPEHLRWLKTLFADSLRIALELHRGPRDAQWLRRLSELAVAHGVALVACGDVRMHVRGRRALLDVLCAVGAGRTLADAGHALPRNGERHLRNLDALQSLYPASALAESVRIADGCCFNLDQLHYEYPHELVPAGKRAAQWLRELTELGLRRRWPDGEPASVRKQVEHELNLIADLRYEHFFLTVHDIVAFARSRRILCQGRGSAANSAVCYALGITEVDPARGTMLFERFISRERNEPPDIDVDFEHERREEVIQYVYNKYGRQRAALAATVICYRPKSAIRDVGKALGMPLEQVDQISQSLAWWDGLSAIEERLAERGLDATAPVVRQLLRLVQDLVGFPRHLSQHVGGFVISHHPLSTLVPVENAAMPERTIIQWDKDDLDSLGLLKVDCLALGILTAIRRCFDLVEQGPGRRAQGPARAESDTSGPWALDPEPSLSLATLPPEDPATYAMIQAADTVGVFQIESRAQMSMLPRLRPANFYDLVIEVAIVRPGPIQGKMVHPYLRRRQGLEKVEYPSEDLKQVFERTLGVPIFQEQVMQLAIVAAGFSPGEADQLRRSMAAWKRHGGLEPFHRRIIDGMLERGYEREFAEQVFEQIKGFGSYGFPESHSASFALLVYASAWLKCHHPAAYAAALINSQPMGFYSPDQLIQDARRHGVKVLPADVRWSGWNCSLEQGPGLRAQGPETASSADPGPCALGPGPSLRLGLRLIRGLPQAAADRIVAARTQAPFVDLQDLADRARLARDELQCLAAANALKALTGHRHRARWAVAGVEAQRPLLAGKQTAEAPLQLPLPSRAAEIRADYASQGLTLGPHPLSLLRTRLRSARWKRNQEILALPHGRPVRAAGLVTLRQRPGTAAGVTFLTLEDESGWLNIVVWKDLAERQRRVLLESKLLGIEGVHECAEGVHHLIAERLYDLTPMLDGLDARSRDFH